MPHDVHESLCQSQRGFHRIGEARTIVCANHKAIHDYGDVMILPAVELRRIRELDDLAVHHGSYEALLAYGLEQFAELTLSAPHERCKDLDSLAFRPVEYDISDLRSTLPCDGPAAIGAVRCAGACVEEAQVIVDFGYGAHGGARVVAGALLLNGDCGRQPFDDVHVGLLHQPEELSCVGAERLHVPSLALGVDGVEGERRLPRAREPGDYGKSVARDLDADVAEIVGAGAAYDQLFFGHSR